MTQLLLAPQPVESGDLEDVVMMDDSIIFRFEEVSLIVTVYVTGSHKHGRIYSSILQPYWGS